MAHGGFRPGQNGPDRLSERPMEIRAAADLHARILVRITQRDLRHHSDGNAAEWLQFRCQLRLLRAACRRFLHFQSTDCNSVGRHGGNYHTHHHLANALRGAAPHPQPALSWDSGVGRLPLRLETEARPAARALAGGYCRGSGLRLRRRRLLFHADGDEYYRDC